MANPTITHTNEELITNQDEDWKSNHPRLQDFLLDGPKRSLKSHTSKEVMNDPMREFLKLHQRMGHISFTKLRELAKNGAIATQFATCDIPICQSCMYAKMSKRPWRNKPKAKYQSKTRPKPGKVVSVDQMVSPTHGLIAQLTGILTKSRYKYATIFVDQGSRLGYVYLQQTASAEETLKGKIAFELYARDCGVQIQGYHADNGVFRAHQWVQHCYKENQTLSFAGVNAHHQNGVTERQIRDLQEMTRTMLIQAARQWPQCITANLWP